MTGIFTPTAIDPAQVLTSPLARHAGSPKLLSYAASGLCQRTHLKGVLHEG